MFILTTGYANLLNSKYLSVPQKAEHKLIIKYWNWRLMAYQFSPKVFQEYLRDAGQCAGCKMDKMGGPALELRMRRSVKGDSGRDRHYGNNYTAGSWRRGEQTRKWEGMLAGRCSEAQLSWVFQVENAAPRGEEPRQAGVGIRARSLLQQQPVLAQGRTGASG